MRMYGKRFMARRMDTRIGDRKESRDGVVYDISEALRYCRVSIAGSTTLVRAWFPANFQRAPLWLKVGTAVRIAHVGGDKSRIEVVSLGLIQPTRVMPPLSGGANTVLLGLYVTAPIEGTGYTVDITAGTYRINGVTYSYSPGSMTMGSGAEMGSDFFMGSDYSEHTLDPMANTEGLWFRYDAFAIGADGVIDYLKGEEWEWTGYLGSRTGPSKPDIPSGHILVGNYILLWSGTTAISQSNIGKEWAAPYPDHLDVVYTYAAPTYEEGPDWARQEAGVGVILGGAATYAPSSPGGLNRGSAIGDMKASASITVMSQYNTPYTWWSTGSYNALEFRALGSASFDGYGDAEIGGFGGDPIPGPADESGIGPALVVSLLLGAGCGVDYTRLSSYIAQSDPGADGYPGYYKGDANSHTALFQVTLVSADMLHPVSTILTFINLDADGNYQ